MGIYEAIWMDEEGNKIPVFYLGFVNRGNSGERNWVEGAFFVKKSDNQLGTLKSYEKILYGTSRAEPYKSGNSEMCAWELSSSELKHMLYDNYGKNTMENKLYYRYDPDTDKPQAGTEGVKEEQEKKERQANPLGITEVRLVDALPGLPVPNIIANLIVK